MSPLLTSTTGTLRTTLRLVAAHHPLRLLAGISGGIVLDALLEVAAAGAPVGGWLRAAADLNIVYCMMLGVFVAVGSILLSRNRLDESTASHLDLIQGVIERAQLPEFERRLAWRNVLDKAVGAFEPGTVRPSAPAPERLAEEAVREAREIG